MSTRKEADQEPQLDGNDHQFAAYRCEQAEFGPGDRLSEAGFAAAVRDALRYYHRPDRLRDNPLLHSRMLLAASADGAAPPAPTRVLKALIREACEHLGEVPRNVLLRQVLELTYLAPMRNQQQVAEALHLSWSTYRRRLASAVQLLAAQLWEREATLAAGPVAEQARGETGEGPVHPRRLRAGWGRALAGLVACAMVGAAAWFLMPWDSARLSAAQPGFNPPSIAVLPFENLAADPANAYFAAGIHDEILTHLAGIRGLTVISRTSTGQYQSHPGNIKAIARELHVSHILEGSVQKVGDRVSINVQLIDARSLTQVWANSYTRTVNDVFGVEGEVAGKVAAALDAELNDSEAARLAAPPTRNAHAYDAFLQGQYFADRAKKGFLKADYDAAVRSYRVATKADPEFALAWARLSIALSNEAADDTGEIDVKVFASQAKASAAKALELAPKLAAAHMAQGWYRLYFLHDRQAAARSFAVALSLQPSNAEALFTMGVISEEGGALIESARYFRKAIALDPRNATYLVALVGVDNQIHDYAAAEQPALLATEIDPESLAAVIHLTDVYMFSGDFERAAAVLGRASSTVKKNPAWTLRRVDLLFLDRNFAEAGKLLAAVQPGGYLPAYLLEVYRGNAAWYGNDRDRARTHFQRARVMIEPLLETRPHSVFLNSNLGWVYARLGRRDDAFAISQKMLEYHLNSSNLFIAMAAVGNAAFIEAQIGNADAAISELKRLYSMPHGNVMSAALLAHDPGWDPLRGDPRFTALVRQYAAQEKLVASAR
ncbi:MAG TPA: hypothetical protein VFK45_00440 [Gammaproteobacteria bacterium]|nr:hypothetical protein [Gammaproteobacteria bacterium]